MQVLKPGPVEANQANQANLANQVVEVESGTGNVATLWDGEVAGMASGLAKVRQEKKVLILADSKAAIAAVRKEGRTGRARSRDLQRVVNTVADIKDGGEEVKLGG